MPIQFKFDSEIGIVFTRAQGLVSFEDIRQHLLEEAADAGAAGYPEIFDASDASTNLTSAQIQQIADRVTSMMKADRFGPTAIIANKDAVFGMARMLETFSELEGGPSFGVSRTLDEGMKWLQAQMAASSYQQTLAKAATSR